MSAAEYIVDMGTGEVLSKSPTPYQLMPGLTDEERASLRLDIEKHGIRVPIDVDEHDSILDGHHRAWIAAELGIDCPRRIVSGLSEEEKRAHAVSVNVFRRNLTREQRREQVARLRSMGMSQRAIAEATNLPRSTVKDDLRQVGESAHLPEKVTGQDGKTYSSTSTTKEKIEQAKAANPVDDRPTVARRMAAEGYTSPQIAREIGITENGMSDFRRRHGIEVPADQVVGRSHRIDANKVLEAMVISLEGDASTIDVIELSALDPDRVEGWVVSLTNSLRSLNRFAKQLKETTQ